MPKTATSDYGLTTEGGLNNEIQPNLRNIFSILIFNTLNLFA